jgi:predicted Zn finger-like uncharacterized protein
MNVSCPQCSTIYRVDPAKVPPAGVRARCSRCGGVIPVGMDTTRRPTPSQPTRATPGAQARMTPATPARPAPARTPPRPTPAATPRATSRTPWSGVQQPRSTPAQPRPEPVVPPADFRQTPVSVPPYTPPPAPPPAAMASVAPPPAAQPAPSASPPSAAARPAGAPGGRRPINPFLSRDPSLRAKRLARALVSDMVAYYPAKHAEGLERGTLKDLFRDEIKKSYEEYVAQVGAEFARGTTHFQEALNEVLGAGRRIF